MTHPIGLFSGDELERRLAAARRDRAFYMRDLLAGAGHRPRSRRAAAIVVGGAALLGLAAFASLRAGPTPLGSISPTDLTMQQNGLLTADPVGTRTEAASCIKDAARCETPYTRAALPALTFPARLGHFLTLGSGRPSFFAYRHQGAISTGGALTAGAPLALCRPRQPRLGIIPPSGASFSSERNVCTLMLPIQEPEEPSMRVALLALTVAGALGTAIVLTGSPAPSNADAITPARVHVLDGDTIRLDGQQSRRAARRLQRPETTRAACTVERDLGETATQRLRQLVTAGGLELQFVPCSCRPEAKARPPAISAGAARSCGLEEKTWARCCNALQKHVWRSKIILLSADGLGTVETMRRTGTAKTSRRHLSDGMR